jgi:microcystin-dependent protein
MGTPFLGEIRIMSFGFAPKSWAQCNGQLLPINQNQALFSLLGTQYGGNGQTTFALPNLQGRVPIHMGGSHTIGEVGGEQAHTLSLPELAVHIHVVNASTNVGNATNPNNALLGKAPANAYGPPTQLGGLNAGTSLPSGGSQPHPNMQPFLTLTFCIALQGIFPSRN